MKKTFYIYKSGTLKRKDDSLAYILKDGNVVYIPIIQVDVIIVFGEVTLNKRVLGLLNLYNVTVLFLNYYGNYIGRYTPKKYSDGKLMIEQFNAYQDDRRMKISRSITFAEIKNMQALVKYYDKKYHCFFDEIFALDQCLKDVDKVTDNEELLLVEAKAKKIYYSCFDTFISNPSFIFKQRYINPPRNEVNAMMSYGYAILYSLFLSDIDKSPLLPQISYIHSLSKQSDSLQFDLADIYKTVIIDRLVIRMINKKQIKKEYFEYKEDDSCYMNKEGIKIFVAEVNKQLEKAIKIGNRYYSYRNLLTRDVYGLVNYLKDIKKQYEPYVMEW